ncbi:hypothetical protein [Verrucomicrobium sp. BvORR106]|uniref:hypothetical protein n=1 Tax=Verrucomicrobium sp. BvORR106 TaxID=1403819 RepID=UPI00056FE8B4|nr:hypothetical protein [Verrucomicrobium sp. BvORR106]
MIETTFKSDWATLKRRLQELHPDLKEDDALPPSGTHPEEVVWHIQRRLGTNVEEAQALFDEANQTGGPCPAQ